MKLFQHDSDKPANLSPLYEAIDNFLFTPGTVTPGAPHIRDAMDLKRMMIMVVFALMPPVIMAVYNTGLQINLALNDMNMAMAPGWRVKLLAASGIGFNPGSILDNMAHGALYFLPVYFITVMAGGFWEVLFASVRRHAISEGFLVTSLLFALTLPPLRNAFGVGAGARGCMLAAALKSRPPLPVSDKSVAGDLTQPMSLPRY